MAIKIDFTCNPFGASREPVSLGECRIHSEGDRHYYFISYVRGKQKVGHLSGYFPKKRGGGDLRSGHRNILHLLRDILNSADLDALGEDYIDIFHELERLHPNVDREHVPSYETKKKPATE